MQSQKTVQSAHSKTKEWNVQTHRDAAICIQSMKGKNKILETKKNKHSKISHEKSKQVLACKTIKKKYCFQFLARSSERG